MHRMLDKTVLFCGLAVAALCLATNLGCSSSERAGFYTERETKVTPFNAIQIGTTEQKAIELLGQPSYRKTLPSPTGNIDLLRWDKQKVEATFVLGKLNGKKKL